MMTVTYLSPRWLCRQLGRPVVRLPPQRAPQCGCRPARPVWLTGPRGGDAVSEVAVPVTALSGGWATEQPQAFRLTLPWRFASIKDRVKTMTYRHTLHRDPGYRP